MTISENIIEEAKQMLRTMVSIPSPSGCEEKVCAAICEQLRAWGLQPKLERNNIILCREDLDFSKKTLVMVAHMDTVEPTRSYTRDPYNPGKDEDRIWGLGSNDDGGSVVSMAAAFRALTAKSLPYNLILALTCEEERSGANGAAYLFGEDGPFSRGELPAPNWTIVGEPTSMRAATSERGLLVIDAYAHGISGHAARQEGKNALYIALEDITALRSHRFSKISQTMGEVRLNVTQISAGTAHNVIPDSCHFVVDIRPTECYTNEQIMEQLQNICQSELKARNLKNVSHATPEDSPLLKCLRSLGIGTFSSPTSSDWIRISVPSIKMGPGESSRSHKADEYILCSEIEEAITTYTRFLTTFYGNTVE